MKARRTHSTKGSANVIEYPTGYRGQPLSANLIFFCPDFAPCPSEYRCLFEFLVKQFAKEMGCGASETSNDYLRSLDSHTAFSWQHPDFSNIILVSRQDIVHGRSRRILQIMPRRVFVKAFCH